MGLESGRFRTVEWTLYDEGLTHRNLFSKLERVEGKRVDVSQPLLSNPVTLYTGTIP